MLIFGNPDTFSLSLDPIDTVNTLQPLQIHIGGTCISRHDAAYIPGVLGGMIPERDFLRSELNFLRHEALFYDCESVTEIHSILVSADNNDDEPQAAGVATHQAFMDWGIPETDGFKSFLCPFRSQLWLSHQLIDEPDGDAEIGGALINPFDLVQTLTDAISALQLTSDKR